MAQSPEVLLEKTSWEEISGAGVYDERRAESVKLLQDNSVKRFELGDHCHS